MLPFEREQLQDFEQRTGMRWREVRPESLRHYGHLADRYAVFLCTTDNCRSGIYLVPASTQPQKPKFYAQLLNFCKDAGLKLLPSFKCDLDGFTPLELPPIRFPNGVWSLTLKLEGDLILRPLGSGQLLTYSVSDLARFGSSVKVAAEDYVLAWKVTRRSAVSSGVDIELGNSITHDRVNIGVTMSSDILTGATTFQQVKTVVNNWEIEGQVSLVLSGKCEHGNYEAYLVYGAASGVASGYVLYRIVRTLPSLLPPLWWTLPENLAIP